MIVPDELKAIVDGGFDVVPAVKLLALRLVQLEQDIARLAAPAPVEDTSASSATVKPRAASKQRASEKGGNG